MMAQIINIGNLPRSGIPQSSEDISVGRVQRPDDEEHLDRLYVKAFKRKFDNVVDRIFWMGDSHEDDDEHIPKRPSDWREGDTDSIQLPDLRSKPVVFEHALEYRPKKEPASVKKKRRREAKAKRERDERARRHERKMAETAHQRSPPIEPK